MRRAAPILTLALTLLALQPTTAAGAVGDQGAGRVAPPDAARPVADAAPTVAEVERLYDRYVLREARQALRLGPRQFEDFAPRLERLLAARRRAQRERQGMARELARLTDPGAAADATVLERRLNALQDQVDRVVRQVDGAYAALEGVLTIEQRARLRVFEQRMERRKLELLAEARARVRQAAGDGAGSPAADGR